MTPVYLLSMNRRLWLLAVLTTAGLFAALGEARAACFTTPVKGAMTARTASFAAAAAVAAPDDQVGDARDWLTGLWLSDYLLGSGPTLYDRGFQQFHPDGTEVMLSSGLPPALGNVCLGVWKQIDPRTVRVRHVAWNWDGSGQLTGTFVMIVTLRGDRSGNRLTGTWTADSFDVDDVLIPDLHAEGILRASRVGVD